jgi:hypothetical protein
MPSEHFARIGKSGRASSRGADLTLRQHAYPGARNHLHCLLLQAGANCLAHPVTGNVIDNQRD